MSSCRVALAEHRYTWRHNQVLKKVAHHIIQLKDSKLKPTGHNQIEFVKAGHSTPAFSTYRKQHVNNGIFHSATDWEVQVDIGKQVSVPSHILRTQLRPDMIITSASSKCIVLIELTVPWEDRFDEAHELKFAKYEPILLEAQRKGWRALCFPIEVGCRGFIGKSTVKMFKSLGMSSMNVKKACLSITEIAEKSSRWLWLRHGSAWLPQ